MKTDNRVKGFPEKASESVYRLCGTKRIKEKIKNTRNVKKMALQS